MNHIQTPTLSADDALKSQLMDCLLRASLKFDECRIGAYYIKVPGSNMGHLPSIPEIAADGIQLINQAAIALCGLNQRNT